MYILIKNINIMYNLTIQRTSQTLVNSTTEQKNTEKDALNNININKSFINNFVSFY